MLTTAVLREATADDHASIVALLAQARLPTADLRPEALRDFIVALDAGAIVGAVGVDCYGEHALLRSLVVAPDWRAHGLATALVEAIEARARAEGLRSLTLLTETAAPFFAARGYSQVDRARAPGAVHASREFSSLCPAGSACMHKIFDNR